MDFSQNKFKDLRLRAEDKIQDSLDNFDNYSLKDIKTLIHEIQVHQVELEMQNDELLRIQEDLKNAESKYEYHYNFAPFGFVNINEKGYIIKSNLTFTKMINRSKPDIIRIDVNNLILWDDRDIFYHINKKLNDVNHIEDVRIRLIKDNSFIYTEVSAKYFDDRNSVDLTFVDISKIVELENKIKTIETSKSLLI